MGWSASTDALYTSIDRKTSDSGYFVNDLSGVRVNLLNYVDDEKVLSTNVSDYVAGVHDKEILTVIDKFVRLEKENLNTKELLSYLTMIQEYDDLVSTISKSGRFVGYVITPRESQTINCSILQAGFMSSDADSFTLYLFDTSHKAAIQSIEISTDSAETIKWTDLDWDISFDRTEGSAGQRYLIGYFEDEVTSDLYDISWTDQSCHVSKKIFGHYMGVSPIRFNSGTLNGVNIPTLQYLESSINCKASGFNLRLNAKCDITNILTENISMFAEALQYRIAIRILSDALSYATLNNVSNAAQLRETWKELITEYTGKLEGGITAEGGNFIKGIMHHLSIDFSAIDAVCLKRIKGQIRGVSW